MKVVLLSYTNDSTNLCNLCARTCYSSNLPSELEFDPAHRSLDHALAGGHESVIEHAVFTFAIEGISRACSHQLVRSRMASFSQQSQRYVTFNDGFDYVTPNSIRDFEEEIVCGIDRDGNDVTETLADEYDSLMDAIAYFYDFAVKHGIPEEDARMVLPNACCTNIIVTMNARELRHFFNLRCCTRAQEEIRTVANSMLSLCKKVAPELFEDAGASCVQNGFCPEEKSCGKAKTLKEIKGDTI